MTATIVRESNGRGVVTARSHVLPLSVGMLLPALGVTAVVLLSTEMLPWQRMWMFAFAVYFACKAWVLSVSYARGQRFTMTRLVQFVFCWAGMQPTPFAKQLVDQSDDRDLPSAIIATGVWKLVVGVLLFASASSIQRDVGDNAAVWVCISAYCLVLHFGVLHLFAAYWQRAGISVEPIMQEPARSQSLNDFWARRWNRAFRDVCHILIIRPTRRRLGPTGAMGLVFIASGLVHELIMSVSAGGGFGGPFAYFVLQIPGCWLERRATLKQVLRRHVWFARVWTAAWVVVPLPLLVNAIFVDRILIPFFQAMGVMR